MLPGVGGTGNLTPLGDLNAIRALKRLPTSPNTGFLQPQFHVSSVPVSQQGQDGEERREQSATEEAACPHLAVGGLLPPPRPDSGSPIPVAANTRPGPHSLIPGPQHSGSRSGLTRGRGRARGTTVLCARQSSLVVTRTGSEIIQVCVQVPALSLPHHGQLLSL